MLKTRLLLVIVAAVVTACGWRLRGTVNLPPVLERPFVESRDAQRGIEPLLREALVDSGARIAGVREEASAVIRVLEDRSETRILSRDAAGRPVEYELFYQVTLEVVTPDGETLESAFSASGREDFAGDPEDTLSREREVESIEKTVRQDVVQSILRRLALVKANADDAQSRPQGDNRP